MSHLRRSAFGFPLFFSFSILLAWTTLRVVLWLKFHPAQTAAGETVKLFLAGFHQDLVMAVIATAALMGLAWLLSSLIALPAGLAGTLARRPWFSAWMRRLFPVMMGLLCMAGVFLLISEWYFFAEFESRFNTVAIDYLIYPQEVFTNIRESYPVPAILAVCVTVGLGLCRAGFRWFAPKRGEWSGKQYSLAAGGWVALCAALALTVRSSETGFSNERVVNELAGNGWASAVRAAWTRDLDYTAFYTTLPPLEA
ncbi:MAG: hypothetical protein EOP86_08515, partial [Verrucomicrobiaceae bacterium]